MAKVVAVKVSHVFEGRSSQVETLAEVSFECQEGERLAIVGPSGCGKSTLLSLIAGLRKPSSGRIYANGRQIEGPPPNIGVMFQKNTLLPWRTVKENVELGLEIRGVNAAERGKKAMELINKYGLRGFERKYPHAVSGGMQKRVALMQVLVYEPDILLLDEAFSSLDAQTRTVVEDEFLRICRETGKTVIMVTHDIAEAISMADRVIVLSARPGRVKADHPIRFATSPASITDVPTFPEFSSYYKTIWNELEIAGGLLWGS